MARDFNGSSNRVRRHATPESTATTNLTEAGWVYVDTTTSERVYWSNGAEPNGYSIEQESGLIKLLINGVARNSSGVSVPSATWFHLAFTRGATTWTVYKDGSAIGSTFTNNPITPAEGFSIGAQIQVLATDTYFRFHDGRVAEFAHWNRELTAGEIAGLGIGYSPLFYPGSRIMYLPLIGRNDPETNLMSANTYTVVGATNIAHPRIIYPSPAQIRRYTTAAVGGATYPGYYGPVGYF